MSVLCFPCQLAVVIVVDVKWLKSSKVAHVDPDGTGGSPAGAHRRCCQVVSAKIGKSLEW
jgi:hypothetical protein